MARMKQDSEWVVEVVAAEVDEEEVEVSGD